MGQIGGGGAGIGEFGVGKVERGGEGNSKMGYTI